VGVTPYRVIFYRAATVFSDLCRSYWFEVDVAGRTWQRGRVRKKEYAAVGLARPVFKKGVVGRQIVVAGRLTRTNGREDKVFEHELSGLEWLNPAAGKFEGRKGQNLYDQLMQYYEDRIPIPVDALWLMENNTRRAILISPGQGAEDRVEAGGAEETEALSETDEALVAEGPGEEDLVRAGVVAEEEEGQACPQCGTLLRVGITFCGKCGHHLEEDSTTPAEEVAVQGSGEAQCPQCGRSLRAGVTFCGKCGYQLGEGASRGPGEKEPAAEESPEREGSAETASGAVCPECGKPTEDGWQACAYCGARLALECAECGKAADPGWVACPYCGTSLGGE
jgi:uncharacterized Zn-finger protein